MEIEESIKAYKSAEQVKKHAEAKAKEEFDRRLNHASSILENTVYPLLSEAQRILERNGCKSELVANRDDEGGFIELRLSYEVQSEKNGDTGFAFFSRSMNGSKLSLVASGLEKGDISFTLEDATREKIRPILEDSIKNDFAVKK